MRSEPSSQLKWRDLDGRQKLEVVDLARRQGVPIAELCRTFGVSRQVLHRAMKAADEAAVAALSPKPKGRRPAPASQKELQALQARNKELEKELEQQRLKYRVAEALLELQRKVDRGERLPGEKKEDHKADLPDAAGSGQPGPGRGLADEGRG